MRHKEHARIAQVLRTASSLINAEKVSKADEAKMERGAKKNKKEKVWVEVTTPPEKTKGGNYVGRATFQRKGEDEKHSEMITFPGPFKLRIKGKKLWVDPKKGEGFFYDADADADLDQVEFVDTLNYEAHAKAKPLHEMFDKIISDPAGSEASNMSYHYTREEIDGVGDPGMQKDLEEKFSEARKAVEEEAQKKWQAALTAADIAKGRMKAVLKEHLVLPKKRFWKSEEAHQEAVIDAIKKVKEEFLYDDPEYREQVKNFVLNTETRIDGPSYQHANKPLAVSNLASWGLRNSFDSTVLNEVTDELMESKTILGPMFQSKPEKREKKKSASIQARIDDVASRLARLNLPAETLLAVEEAADAVTSARFRARR